MDTVLEPLAEQTLLISRADAAASPQIIFGHYRGLVRGMDAEKWVGITLEAVEASRKQAGVCGECEAVHQAMVRRKA